MNAWLLEPIYWNWWILGVVLLVIEATAPGFFFLWMGIAALLVGLTVFIFSGLDWTYQLLLFSVFSIGSILAWRARLHRYPTPTADPLLNRRGHQYVGRTFTLAEPVVNSYGKIRVDDSTWKVRVDQDCPAGTRLRITDVDGVLLHGVIEPANPD